jgi:hypothetical protein
MNIARAQFLLIVFLLAAVLPAQLRTMFVSLPLFIKHYQEHCTESDNVSFLAFWDLHFGAAAQQHAHEHDHGSLPLKGHSVPVFNWVASSLPASSTPGLSLPITAKDGKPGDFMVFPASSCFSDIWQPPKSA